MMMAFRTRQCISSRENFRYLDIPFIHGESVTGLASLARLVVARKVLLPEIAVDDVLDVLWGTDGEQFLRDGLAAFARP